MEILDTRGIAESEQLNNNITAEEELTEAVKSFSPDAAVLVLNCTHRDDVDKDVRFMNIGFGAGSVISSTIAASGTMTIGKAAAAYYIEHKPIEKIMSKSPFGKRSA